MKIEEKDDERYSPQKRRYARRLVLQALYQWQLADTEIAYLEAEVMSAHVPSKIDVTYFRELLKGVIAEVEAVDAILKPVLDRDIAALDPIERALLRLSVYELNYRLDIPPRVVINEAIELAKTFGATDAHKYVNGVLDKLVKNTQGVE